MPKAQLPVQPVPKPIICNPYTEPDRHWDYDRDTGSAIDVLGRREAGYWYKNDQIGAAQRGLFMDEQRDDLPLINLLRKDVRRWRESDFRGATNMSRELLRYWARLDRPRPLFFCQREAVETIIYLVELRLTGKSSRTGFHRFALTDSDIQQLLSGERPNFYTTPTDYYPTFADFPGDPNGKPLRRVGCKMATGAGKTVAMAMLIAWTFCNRAVNPYSSEFPNAVLVACPNLTVKERLQVLRPENPNNYFAEFDLVPLRYRPFLQKGKVLITNWHLFNPRSEHEEGGKSYAVVNKGPDTPESFARYVLDDLYDHMPIMVLNDEGHHCWRPAVTDNGTIIGQERKQLETDKEEATVWIEGLDRLNNAIAAPGQTSGIALCVDMSATPFYLKGSGHPEGRPFPWLISDFGLVDAIESGIVKVPRLPVDDKTGRPQEMYFRLWENIRDSRTSGARKLTAEHVYSQSKEILLQLAQQWRERFSYVSESKPGQDAIPPALIIVCDNTKIAEYFYHKISGETVIEQTAEPEVGDHSEEDDEEVESPPPKNPKKRIAYGPSALIPEFSNTENQRYTIRIDSKLLAEAESTDPKKSRRHEAEALRRIVATVGKPGQPGEHVRCVVSVGMLTEGWDACNVTHILGLRAFASQLLCEQVVGRGLRRMDYTPDPSTGNLTEEYVDVYGIPFSIIPFKGRPLNGRAAEDRPKNHLRTVPDRSSFEIRFPLVEGYAFISRGRLVQCDVDSMEPLDLDGALNISTETVYHVGETTSASEDLAECHPQYIKFEITRSIVERITDSSSAAFGLHSRHLLFPQVYQIVEQYFRKKITFRDEAHKLTASYPVIADLIATRIEPSVSGNGSAFMPILNRYKPYGTTSEIDFKTTKPCFTTSASHINQVIADTDLWEQSVAFRLEAAALKRIVRCYVKTDQLGLTIPYHYRGALHRYEPNYLVELISGRKLLLDVSFGKDEDSEPRHQAAIRWVSAVNNWGGMGNWGYCMCNSPATIEDDLAGIDAT